VPARKRRRAIPCACGFDMTIFLQTLGLKEMLFTPHFSYWQGRSTAGPFH
jgi:hypothetical protein